jgi:hypothetical protein
MAQTVALRPWLFAERPSGSAAGNYPVDQEYDERPDDCSDEIGALAGLVPVDQMAEPAGQASARYTQNDRDDAPARIATWHKQLGDHPGDASDDNPPQPSVIWIQKRHQHGLDLSSSHETAGSLRLFNQPSFQPCNAHFAN